MQEGAAPAGLPYLTQPRLRSPRPLSGTPSPQRPPAPQHALAQPQRFGDLGHTPVAELAAERLVRGLTGDRAPLGEDGEILVLPGGGEHRALGEQRLEPDAQL